MYYGEAQFLGYIKRGLAEKFSQSMTMRRVMRESIQLPRLVCECLYVDFV